VIDEIDQRDEIDETDEIDDQNDTFKKQKHIFQSMTPDQKLKIALSLYHSARQLKAAGLRAQNPDWSEEKVQNRLREIFLYART
jgi:hypothetical protein